MKYLILVKKIFDKSYIFGFLITSNAYIIKIWGWVEFQ